jgi:hypothetical protein
MLGAARVRCAGAADIGRGFMSTKLRPITVWVEPALLDRVERLARQDRRPMSQLIRNLLEDAVAQSRRTDVAGAAHVTA